LRWEELDDGLDRRAFTTPVVLQRIAEHGDLFAPVLAGGQSLEAAVAAVTALDARDQPH
jgi:DNA primase